MDLGVYTLYAAVRLFAFYKASAIQQYNYQVALIQRFWNSDPDFQVRN